MVRISSAAPEVIVVSHPGRHPLLKKDATADNEAEDAAQVEDEMDTDDAPLLLEPPSRFSSTMMTMDMPP